MPTDIKLTQSALPKNINGIVTDTWNLLNRVGIHRPTLKN